MNTLFTTEDENVKTFFEKTGLDINEVTINPQRKPTYFSRWMNFKIK